MNPQDVLYWFQTIHYLNSFLIGLLAVLTCTLVFMVIAWVNRDLTSKRTLIFTLIPTLSIVGWLIFGLNADDFLRYTPRSVFVEIQKNKDVLHRLGILDSDTKVTVVILRRWVVGLYNDETNQSQVIAPNHVLGDQVLNKVSKND